VSLRSPTSRSQLQVQVSLPLTAFPSASWRFLNVAEPEPSAFTVIDMTLASTGSYSVPEAWSVSSTEFS
jgi:hypothetical protein